MKKNRRILLLAIVPVVALGFAVARLQAGPKQGTRVAAAAVPARTSPVRRLLAARPFALSEPYVDAWRAEQPRVRAGWLVVLEVDPRFVEPTQLAMPVLMVGDETVECVNFGFDSGRVIGIVRSEADEQGEPKAELTGSAAWFGAPELAERVDAAWIARERARAKPEDVATLTTAEVEAARARGEEALRVASRVELDRAAAQWILEYSPQERELAEGLLVPVTK